MRRLVVLATLLATACGPSYRQFDTAPILAHDVARASCSVDVTLDMSAVGSNTWVETFAYDDQGRLSSRQVDLGDEYGGAATYRWTWNLREEALVIGTSDSDGAEFSTTWYTWDLGRVTQACTAMRMEGSDTVGRVDECVDWTYDEVGRLAAWSSEDTHEAFVWSADGRTRTRSSASRDETDTWAFSDSGFPVTETVTTGDDSQATHVTFSWDDGRFTGGKRWIGEDDSVAGAEYTAAWSCP